MIRLASASLLPLLIGALWNTPASAEAADPPTHVCDRLAASPDDAHAVVPAVPGDELDAGSAIAIRACRTALDEFPDAARFQAQLGRALFAAGQIEEAAEPFRKAAEKGYAFAMAFLGMMYAEGKGVPQDYAEAAKWYRQAVEQGHARAQNHLGRLYFYGHGVPQDYAEAAKWLRKAGEQGDAHAQNWLGWMYTQGQGVPQDYAEAAKWLRKAAAQGEANAQNWLGWLYENGRGFARDHAEAEKWYRKAAEQGFAEAQRALDTLLAREEQDYARNFMEVTHARVFAQETIGEIDLYLIRCTKSQRYSASYRHIYMSVPESFDLLDEGEVRRLVELANRWRRGCPDGERLELIVWQKNVRYAALGHDIAMKWDNRSDRVSYMNAAQTRQEAKQRAQRQQEARARAEAERQRQAEQARREREAFNQNAAEARETFFANIGLVPDDAHGPEPQELAANPFAFEGEIAVYTAEFMQMRTASEGIFSVTGRSNVPFVVKNLPSNLLTRAGPVVVAGRIAGNTSIGIFGMEDLIPMLTFVDVFACEHRSCSDFWGQP